MSTFLLYKFSVFSKQNNSRNFVESAKETFLGLSVEVNVCSVKSHWLDLVSKYQDTITSIQIKYQCTVNGSNVALFTTSSQNKKGKSKNTQKTDWLEFCLLDSPILELA